jgi:long-chain acyl-CoA synthetase
LVLKDGLKSPAALVDALVRHQATGFSLVPAGFALLRKLTKTLLGKTAGHLRWVEIGSAAMPAEVRDWLVELLPQTRLCHHYGLTEASRAAFVELGSPEGRRGSIGRASPNVELWVQHEEGRPAEPGEEGELCVRGGMIAREYLGQERGAGQELGDDFVRTGDIATRDVDGYFHLRGRISDRINVGGLKVDPEEVERELLQHPDVRDAACVPMADPSGFTGERVKAFVVPRPGDDAVATLTAAALGDWLRRRNVEAHKLPAAVVCVTELPRTASGKLLRRKLRES